MLQDILVYAAKGLAMYEHRMISMNRPNLEVEKFILDALYVTVTNVNFDPESIMQMIKHAYDWKLKLAEDYKAACRDNNIKPEELKGPAEFSFIDNMELMLEFAPQASLEKRFDENGKAVTGLEELVLYGVKGAAAYAHHAFVLGKEDAGINAGFIETLNFLAEEHSAEEILAKALETGKLNYDVMELLDSAHTGAYGHPQPTPLRITPVEGKAILVSGHDLRDLKNLLEQTEGKGINIYTHGEMLPAHGYPELKKHKHLVGNYGGAWQDQHKEFNEFPGAILMTTNCIQKPKESYKERIFTKGLVGWPGVTNIQDDDFSRVIEKALECDGFRETAPEKTILTGFGHNAVLNVADKVIDAVKNGKIKHFYLVGGCDGAKSGRNYYTEFAQKAPKDSIILTLACGKFRFNKLEFGDIDGIPRLLDIGQCNDAYSAIKIASALAEAFGTGVNELPLSLILSWYEQKAVAILLTLLYLGIKNIRIGPTLPAFLEPEVLQILVDNYNLAPIKTAEEDLAATLA